MKKEHARDVNFVEPTHTIEGVRIGRIVGMDDCGRFLVDYFGSPSGPIAARITNSVKAETFREGNHAGREVLLVFENNDPGLPIIIGAMYSLIDEIAAPETAVIEAEEAQEVIVDGKRISFEAENEIVLKCGKASITLTRAGKVLIRGDYVLSHSSGENRIRGGSVSVN